MSKIAKSANKYDSAGHILTALSAISGSLIAAASPAIGTAVVAGTLTSAAVVTVAVIPAAIAVLAITCYFYGEAYNSSADYYTKQAIISISRISIFAWLIIIDAATESDLDLSMNDFQPLFPSKNEILRILLQNLTPHHSKLLKLVSLYVEIVDILERTGKTKTDIIATLSIIEMFLIEMISIHKMDHSLITFNPILYNVVPAEFAIRRGGNFWVQLSNIMFLPPGTETEIQTRINTITSANSNTPDCSKKTKWGLCCNSNEIVDTFGNQCIPKAEPLYTHRGTNYMQNGLNAAIKTITRNGGRCKHKRSISRRGTSASTRRRVARFRLRTLGW